MSQIIIISGPAGSGKNTVSDALMREFKNVERVITSTSRPPRGAEKDGVDYHFLSTAEFEKKISAGDFFEYAKVHDRYYGTTKAAVTERLGDGRDLLLIIDVQGARTWRKIAAQHPDIFKNLTTVFIRPKDAAELRARLCGRATEADAEIERRLKTAVEELKCAGEFDEVIDSGTREHDYEALKNIYLKLKARENGK